MFSNRRLVIATKHRKEQVIAPWVEKTLGALPFVANDLDTDMLGTFSGEVAREHDPITTLRLKCKLAMEKHQCDLAIASEGSFGPHPTYGFIPADDEWVMLLDTKNNLEIVARELNTQTNFAGQEINSETALLEFAARVQFPSHALIVRKEAGSLLGLKKGIDSWSVLLEAFNSLQKTHGSVYAETDMRAMFNPTRMNVIEIATQKLMQKVQRTCSACGTPGFDVTRVNSGLPCSLCGLPTASTLSFTYTCNRCAHEEEQIFPHQKQTEDPMYCSHCNP
jgi:hypothetical protein